MDWGQMRTSGNVEDRRGANPVGRGLQLGVGGMVVVGLVSLLFGANPLEVIGAIQGGAGRPSVVQNGPGLNDQDKQFIASITGDMEDLWGNYLQSKGKQYQPATTVLYGGATQTACGTGQAAMGPFYCPEDGAIYLDTSFYGELRATATAQSEFARAYVIAHEYGHHIQNLLGISDQVRAAKARTNEVNANALSVRLELQADCFAGVWGNSAARRGLISVPEMKKALEAASEIGDDRIQQQSRGYVVPDSFTHGSSAQRMRWFSVGLDGGDPARCDTFGQQI